ncbi:hypothetical protein [Paludisphaera sp.]|uniref:EF-hand domain-containing protein n=1 Tax=Paludisphaera sp. TaxID=2017432 RepID=UPI00301E01B9
MFTRFVAGGLSLSLALVSAVAAPVDEPESAAPGKAAGIFRHLDADKDGVLSQSEVDAASRPAVRTILKSGDANKDGKIDAQEFETLGDKLTAIRKARGTAKPESAKKPSAKDSAGSDKDDDSTSAARRGQRIKDLVEKFRANDADKDGRLSRQEFQGRPAVFDRLDMDRDGYLDRDDLKAIRAERKAAREKAEAEKPADKS